jgi:hypothetical protein
MGRALGALGGRLRARLAAARADHPDLDELEVAEHLLTAVGPLVELVAARRPERAAAVLDGLHQVYLDLVVADRIGPKAPDLGLEICLKYVLSALPDRLAEDPSGVAGRAVRELMARAAGGLSAQLAWVEEVRIAGDLPA